MRGPWLPSPPMSRAVMGKCTQRTGPGLWVDISEREIFGSRKSFQTIGLVWTWNSPPYEAGERICLEVFQLKPNSGEGIPAPGRGVWSWEPFPDSKLCQIPSSSLWSSSQSVLFSVWTWNRERNYVSPGSNSSQLLDTCNIRENTQNLWSLKHVHGYHPQTIPQYTWEWKVMVNRLA